VPSVRVYNSTEQTLTSGVFGTLAFDTELWDTDGMHSNTVNNTRLTCVKAGRYMFFGNFLFEPNVTGLRDVIIQLNGSGANQPLREIKNATLGGVASTTIAVATVFELVVGDYAEILARQTSGGNLKVQTAIPYSPSFGASRIG
jgi:hypothetical protein